MTELLPGDKPEKGFWWHLGDWAKAQIVPRNKYLADRQLEMAEVRMAFDAQRDADRQQFELVRFKLQHLAQVELQKSQYLKQYELQKDSQEFQQYLAEQRLQFEAQQNQDRLQLEEKRLFVQWQMQRENQRFHNEQAEVQFQRAMELADLSKENQLEIERFRHECASLQFEAQFEKRKELEWALKQYERETQIILAEKQRDNLLQSAEFQRIFDKYPLNIMFTPTLEWYKNYCRDGNPVPPLIITSPPIVKFDPAPRSFAPPEFLEISDTVETELRIFLAKHYGLKNSSRPAKPMTGAWKSKAIHWDAALEPLFYTHKTIPTLVLESTVSGKNFNLRVAWWDMRLNAVSYPFDEIHIPWQEVSNLSNFLAVLHCLLTGLILDEYYLFHYQVCPKLPEILVDLMKDIPDETAKDLMGMVVSRYQVILKAIEEARPTWIPNLALDLAQVLANLPNQSWARDQVRYSQQVFTKLTVNS